MIHKHNALAKSKWDHYVKEHVLVMELALDRKLLQNEVVHHIDGDKKNNDLANLFLTSHAEHRNVHQSLQEVGYALIKAKLVLFDPATGSYKADLKLRELLEQPGEANQQPSRDGNDSEGSTTRRESQADDNSPTSAGHR